MLAFLYPDLPLGLSSFMIDPFHPLCLGSLLPLSPLSPLLLALSVAKHLANAPNKTTARVQLGINSHSSIPFDYM